MRREKLRARVGAHVAPAERARASPSSSASSLGVPVRPTTRERAAPRRAPGPDADGRSDAPRVGGLRSPPSAPRSPSLLVLEDLHWGDLPTVQLRRRARCARSRDQPLHGARARAPRGARALPRALGRARACRRSASASCSRKASERLVREVLGDATTDATVVARVVERAGGNAFYLEELIRAVATGKRRRRCPRRCSRWCRRASKRSTPRRAACCARRASSARCSGAAA